MPTRTLLAALLLTVTAQAAPPRFPITKSSVSRPDTIDGKAAINDYPWDYAHSGGVKPDFHGPDTKQVADGLILTGDEKDSDHVYVNQIAGTAITQAGQGSALDYFRVKSAINGYSLTGTDCHVGHGFIQNIVKDAFIVTGGGNDYLNNLHAWGADRGFHISARIHAHGLFADNNRVGIVFDSTSDGSTVDDLTLQGCWERGAVLNANGITIDKISGDVSDAAHPNARGIELGEGTCHETLSGFLMVHDGSFGWWVRGDRQRIWVNGGGWNVHQDSTLMVIDHAVTNSDINIRCNIEGGICLDCSNGWLKNCDVHIACGGHPGAVVIYPGGGTGPIQMPGTTIEVTD